jgi:hypothetical protein
MEDSAIDRAQQTLDKELQFNEFASTCDANQEEICTASNERIQQLTTQLDAAKRARAEAEAEYDKETKEKIKERKEDIKEKTKTKEEANKKINDIAIYQAGFGTGWAKYSTAIQFGRTVTQISNMFFPQEDYWGYADLRDKVFSKVNDILYFEDSLCKVNIPFNNPVSNLVLNNANGKIQSGAHIEGQKDGPVKNQNNQNVYNYLITGAIAPNNVKDFNAIIVGKGSSEKTLRQYQVYERKDNEGNTIGYDLTITDYIELNENNQPTITTQSFESSIVMDMGTRPIRLEMVEQEFTQVCIRFLSNPERHFTETFLEHNEMCNELST